MGLEAWTYDIDYDELQGTETATFGDSAAIERIFRFPDFEQRNFFINDLLGYPGLQTVPRSGVRPITRVLPDEHPVYRGFFATEATTEGMGPMQVAQGGRSASYDGGCRIKATYRPLPFAVKADGEITTELDRYVKREYSFSAEYLTINGLMKWVTRTANKVIGATPGIILPFTELTYTWYDVPAKPESPFIPPNLTTIETLKGSRATNK